MDKEKNIKNTGETLAFKIIYSEDIFQLGFAKKLDDEKIKVITEFNLEPNEFKFYLRRMLAAVATYNQSTGKNMIEEIYEEGV